MGDSHFLIEEDDFVDRLNLMPRPEKVEYKLNAVSMFSGGGGLDLGITWAGFDVRYSSDIEWQLCETIKHNFPSAFVENKDIINLTGDEIRAKSNLTEVDLIVGGPPCQAFSILGQRNSFNDPRGQLVFEYARIITELKPRAFLFENVPGFLTVNNGRDWNDFLDFINKNTNYKISYKIVNAADYGAPQIRKRVIVIGFKDHNINFKFPAPLFADSTQWIKSKYALQNVDNLINHRIREHSDRVKNRYLKVAPGERDSTDRTDRINPEKPSGTVLVGSKAGGGRPFIHPYEPRHITIREAARLQTFPDWYEFKNTETWQYRAVGNAVPPLLGYKIGLAISNSLINK